MTNFKCARMQSIIEVDASRLCCEISPMAPLMVFKCTISSEGLGSINMEDAIVLIGIATKRLIMFWNRGHFVLLFKSEAMANAKNLVGMLRRAFNSANIIAKPSTRGLGKSFAN